MIGDSYNFVEDERVGLNSRITNHLPDETQP
jgi:hypothetical protein